MTEFRDYKNVSEEKDEEVQYFCKFTFGQFFTLLVLEVVTLGFVFYLGAKYGNEYLKISNEDNRPAITEVIAKGDEGPQGGNPALNDKELQAMAKDVVQGGNQDLKERVRALLEQQKTGGVSTTGQAAPTTATPSIDQAAQTLAAMQEAQKVVPPAAEAAVTQPPAEKPTGEQAVLNQRPTEPTESGAVRVKSPTNAQFSIQVGSYPNIDEANAKIGDWRTKGYPAFMMIADIPDRGRWYRVRIGGFASKEDAQKYLDKMKEHENTEAIIVLNEQ